MKAIHSDLQGLIVFELDAFEDERGVFLETWNKERYHAAGLVEQFVQDNISYSKKGVLRGLHFQNPHSQGKLVTVLLGEVFDVVVDIRPHSPTIGKWQGFVLSDSNRFQLYVPPGFAHGFLVKSEKALVQYKCTDLYRPGNECTLVWNDPDIAIAWGMTDPIMSRKDREGKRLKELPLEKPTLS